jgi:hypothetical protein
MSEATSKLSCCTSLHEPKAGRIADADEHHRDRRGERRCGRRGAGGHQQVGAVLDRAADDILRIVTADPGHLEHDVTVFDQPDLAQAAPERVTSDSSYALAAEPSVKNAMRHGLVACARATSGQPAAAPRAAIKWRRCMCVLRAPE